MSGDNRSDRQQGRLRRMFSRGAAGSAGPQADEPRQPSEPTGCTPIASCQDRQEVSVIGTLRAVTVRPRAGIPALEAELFDGSDSLDVVWLGRRSITGIEPGRRLVALFNPRYELRPVGSE
jgi:hypothetical protein